MLVRVKENSWLAKIASKKMRTPKIAMVFGKTIHLYNTSREEFLQNEKWVCHELAHVNQYVRYGYVRFMFMYLVESIRKGYRNNKFELEARSKERDPSILLDFVIS